MKVILIIMMGLPFSGKSTLAQRLSEALYISILSYDNDIYAIYREKVPPGTSSAKEFDMIESIAREQISEKLISRQSLIYDDLCLEREDRQKLILLAQACNALPIFIHVDTPVAVIEQRRKSNIKLPNRNHLPSSKLKLDISLLQSPGPEENAIVVKPETSLKEILKAIYAKGY